MSFWPDTSADADKAVTNDVAHEEIHEGRRAAVQDPVSVKDLD